MESIGGGTTNFYGAQQLHKAAQGPMTAAGAMVGLGRQDTSPTGPPPSASPMQMALDDQRSLLRELHAGINYLEQRLTLVLAPEPPTGADSSKIAVEPVHIVDRINDHSRALRAAITRLGGLVERLHL